MTTFPPDGAGGNEAEDLWTLIGVHARCPATAAVAERWAGGARTPAALPEDYERAHRTAADLCRRVRELAARAGPLFTAVPESDFPMPADVPGPPGLYSEDPETLFLLALFGVAGAAGAATRSFGYAERVQKIGPGGGWSPWRWARVSDLASAAVLVLEWLADPRRFDASSSAVPNRDAAAPLIGTPEPPTGEEVPVRARGGRSFEGGTGRFRGVGISVPPTHRAILEVLTGPAGREMLATEIAERVQRKLNRKDAADGQQPPPRKRKRVTPEQPVTHVTRLNDRLGEAFGIKTTAPDRPVTGRGEGAYLAYRLDEGRLPAAAGP